MPLASLPASTRRRSSTFSAITAWAAHVQPGSPGSPPSTRRCRPSSPNTRDFAVDLTNLGYTSVFVHLPQTPSPMTSKFANPDSFPVPPTCMRPTRLKGFRSLSILRPRSKSTATPTLSPSPTNIESPKVTAASIATRKKALYAYAKSSKSNPKTAHSSSKPKTGLPPALAYELALMQFADGGSTEENIKRLMEARARAAAPAGTKELAVSDVYRDDKGGLWLDREQEMEYVHLLGGHDASHSEKWVSFGGEVKEGKAEDDDDEERCLAIASLATDGRRGSEISIGSLDLGDIIKPAEEDAKFVKVPLSLPPLSKPSPVRATQDPILIIPSRPRHGRHHLQASSSFFLLDLNAFSVPCTPCTPHTPDTPQTPRASRTLASPATRYTPEHPSQSQKHTEGVRGAARRRPAPLDIVAHAPVRGVSPDHGNDENGDSRKDFLEASFRPAPKPEPVQIDIELPVKMHREAMYRSPMNLNQSRDGHKQGSWKALKKTSRPFLSLFGLK